MSDRHEQSRAAFEAVHHDFSHSWDDGKKQYRDIHTMMYWDTWCRALDYAAEQQAKQDCVYCGGKSPISTATQCEPTVKESVE